MVREAETSFSVLRDVIWALAMGVESNNLIPEAFGGWNQEGLRVHTVRSEGDVENIPRLLPGMLLRRGWKLCLLGVHGKFRDLLHPLVTQLSFSGLPRNREETPNWT